MARQIDIFAICVSTFLIADSIKSFCTVEILPIITEMEVKLSPLMLYLWQFDFNISGDVVAKKRQVCNQINFFKKYFWIPVFHNGI